MLRFPPAPSFTFYWHPDLTEAGVCSFCQVFCFVLLAWLPFFQLPTLPGFLINIFSRAVGMPSQLKLPTGTEAPAFVINKEVRLYQHGGFLSLQYFTLICIFSEIASLASLNKTATLPTHIHMQILLSSVSLKTYLYS